jgi:hypothetical protein
MNLADVKKLTEREEAIHLGRDLFYKDFFNGLNIRTIKLLLETPP